MTIQSNYSYSEGSSHVEYKSKIAKDPINALLNGSQNLEAALHFQQISVIDQTRDGTGARGMENCGYHALRNSLEIGTLLASNSPKGLDHLKSVSEFKKVYEYWESHVPYDAEGQRDVSVAALHEFKEDILSGKKHRIKTLDDYKNTLDALMQKQHGLPVISIATGVMDPHHKFTFSFGGGVIGLEAASNVYQLAHANQDFVHLFVVGLTDFSKKVPVNHWLSVVLCQKNRDWIWFGMDSFHNTSDKILPLMGTLHGTMCRANHYSKEAYHEIIGDVLSRRAGWLDDSGELNKEHEKDKQQFLKEKEFHVNCTAAYEYMKKAEWFRFPNEHAQPIEELAKIVKFYANHLPEGKLKKSFHQMNDHLQEISRG